MANNKCAFAEVCLLNSKILITTIGVFANGEFVIVVELVDIFVKTKPKCYLIPNVFEEYGIYELRLKNGSLFCSSGIAFESELCYNSADEKIPTNTVLEDNL